MVLLKFLLPDQNDRADFFTQYERILSKNPNRFFFPKEANAVNEPPTTLVLKKST